MSQSKQTTTASRDPLRPSTTTAALKYLTVRPERIAAVTLRELAACGIPERALGLVSTALRVTLVGCVALNDHARSYLPAELGGTAAGLNASDDTLDLADASFARSPAGRELRGASSSPTSRIREHSPPRRLFGAPLRLSPSSPTRLALARASEAAAAAAELAGAESRAADADAAEATAARDVAAVEMRQAERRHTRAHPRGELVDGTDVGAGRRTGGLGARRGVAGGADSDEDDQPRRRTDSADGGGDDDGDGGARARPGGPPDAGGGGSPGDDGAPSGAPERAAAPGEAAGDGSEEHAPPATAADAGAVRSEGAEYDELLRATAEYERLAAAAERARRRASAAEEQARTARSEAESSLSVLSAVSAGGAAPSSPRHRHDAAIEQQSLAASVASEGQKADVIAGLLAHRKKFPLIAKAMLRRGAGDGLRAAALGDLPLLALLPAYHAAQLQEHGLAQLRAATHRAASANHRAGVNANRDLADRMFDLVASEAIAEKAVDMVVAPLDLCAGVLPLTQLGLHFWFKHYVHVEEDATKLVALAQAVHFVKDRVLDPAEGLADFLPAWSAALGEEDDIPASDVYHALLTNLFRDKEATGASSAYVTVDGVSMNWTAFALQTCAAWRSASGDGRRCTRQQLIKFVRTLRAFGEARFEALGDPLPPPTRADGSARAFVAMTSAAPDDGPGAPPSASAAQDPGPRAPPPATTPASAARERPPRPGPDAAADSAEWVTPPPLRLETYVLPNSPSILAASPLLRAGWKITLAEGAKGSKISVPGVPRAFPLTRDKHGGVIVSFVETPRGLLLRNDSTAHRCLISHDFILDTGAEVCIVGAGAISLLGDMGTVPAIPITGVGGARTVPLDSGFLVIEPPHGARVHPSEVRKPSPADHGPDGPMLHYASLCAPTLEATEVFFDGEPTSEPDAATIAEAAVLAARVRATAFPPVQSLDGLAEKFNLNNATALGAFVDACPLGLASGLKRQIEPGKDYSRGLAAGALLKAPAIHASRYTYSMTLRDAVPHGHVWWTDVSNQRPPDFDGNVYSRLFAEERTGCAHTFYSARKDAATLIEHIGDMVTWINQHVPGGKLMVLRCDFASEAVKQGHGDDIYTAAMSAYCDANPGFRFIPVAPNSQALNRAENTWGRIHGGAYLNARRARIGAPGWSIMERCAVFQHNHTPAPHALDPASRRCTRWEALTQETFDVSTMLGFPGQSGFTHRADGKANAFRTPTDPVLYMHPSSALHAQLVFNLRSFKIMVVRDVSLTVDPYACALAVAASALHSPAGAVHTPTDDAYAARLNALLTWRPLASHDAAVVLNDPLHGLPVAVFELTASVAPDGSLIMTSDHDVLGSLEAPLGDGGGTVPPALTAAAPDAPPCALPAGDAWAPVWTTSWAKGAAGTLAKRIAAHIALPSAPPWRIAFAPGKTKRLTSASGPRFAAYSGATTARAFSDAHAAYRLAHSDSTSWHADLTNDLTHGLLAAAPNPDSEGAPPAHPTSVLVASAAGGRAKGRPGRERGAARARDAIDGLRPVPAAAPAHAGGGLGPQAPSQAPAAAGAGTPGGEATAAGGSDKEAGSPTTKAPPRTHRTKALTDPAVSAPAARPPPPAGPFGDVWLGIQRRVAAKAASAAAGRTPPSWTAWGPSLARTAAPTPAERAVLIASLDRAIDEHGGPRPTSSYVAEKQECDRIERMEPAPLPGRSPGPDTFPDTSGDPRLYTAAYERGARVLRIALAADNADDKMLEPDLELLAKSLPSWGSEDRRVPPALAHMAAPPPGAPTAPASVAAARALPDFDAPHGWRAAIGKEIARVEGFRAWRLATAQEVREDRRLYGDARVSIGYIVAVLTCKLDPAGGPRSQEVLNKFRVAIADKADAANGVITHSNCADEISNRLITAIAPAIGAHQDSIDVGGAYFHGIPLSMLLGGRRLYVRIPGWLAALFPAYPLRGKGGSSNFLLIEGNMPGRCDAGRIWQARFDEFLLSYGLKQLLVDRRVWTGHSERGALIVHDHVDDSRITSTTVAAREHFHAAWALEFGETIVTKALSEDFTGLRHRVVGPLTTTISCEGVIQRLAALLVAYPLEHNERCDWPLPAMAPRLLMEGPTPARPLAPHLLSVAQPILGTCGFVGGLARPDSYYSYSLLSKHTNEKRLTTYVFRCIVRLGHYLVRTRGLHLHITTPQLARHQDGTTSLDLFSCFVDSSHGNGEDGASHGGFLIASCAPPAAPPSPASAPALPDDRPAAPAPAPTGQQPAGGPGKRVRFDLPQEPRAQGAAQPREEIAAAEGAHEPPAPPSDPGNDERVPSQEPAPGAPLGGGGAIAWRCVAPPAGDDSSAAAELRLATLAYKYVIAARFLQTELEVGAAPAKPTPLYLDAQAVLDGTNCERLAKSSRWLAMRYAMLRWGIACGTIAPRKLLTAMNPADGLTKCLTGVPFENGRARLLGLPLPHPVL